MKKSQLGETPDLAPAIERISKDLKQSAGRMDRETARRLVDTYYDYQRFRIAGGQRAERFEGQHPHACMEWLHHQQSAIENRVQSMLDSYSMGHPVGRWSRSVIGIGPVLAAGLLAYIDPFKAATAGDIWRCAGLDPTVTWGKGEKMPWNDRLKVLCWKIGESFTKTKSHERSFYGPLLDKRRAYEDAKNERKEYAEQAAKTLAEKTFKKTESATYQSYLIGRLPDGRMHLRAQRWTVKLFLSHWHHAMHVAQFGAEPPKPFAFGVLLHPEAHYIPPPNLDVLEESIALLPEGWRQAAPDTSEEDAA